MRPLFLLLIGMVMYGTSVSFAEMYRYVDNQGVVHYTNDLANVPEDKRSSVSEESEYQNDSPDVATPKKIAPAPMQRAPFTTDLPSGSLKTDRAKQKAALEAEYKSLVLEKAAIDNDASFQKRKNKTKYKHRPYIEEKVKTEEQLNQRLSEIEAAIKQLDQLP